MTAPTPALSTFTDGVVARAVDLNSLGLNITNLYNFTMGGFRTFKPQCAVRMTTGQSISSGTDTVMSWSIADVNTDNMWVPGGPDHMTVQTAGTYFLYAQAVHQAGFSTFAVRLLVNGTSSTTNAVGSFSASANGGNVSALVPLAAGATIYGSVLQTTGASVTLATTLGSARMFAFFVSP